MYKILIMLLSFLLLSAHAQARIGETLSKCESRYGPPVEKLVKKGAVDEYYYVTDAYRISIGFTDGIAIRINYQLKAKEKMSLKRIETLLRQNAVHRFKDFGRAKKTWYFEETIKGEEIRFRSEDNMTFSVYYLKKNILAISSSKIP